MENPIMTLTIPESWEDLFFDQINELEQILEILEKCKRIVPSKEKIFNVYELTKINEIKVVILGDGPILGYSSTTGTILDQGLAYSTSSQEKITHAQKAIFKKLKEDIEDFEIPIDGDLSKWSKNGIFLLNISLTSEQIGTSTKRDPKKENPHIFLWLSFIKSTIKHIISANPNVIFLLWGKKVQNYEKYIGNKPIKLFADHPSSSFDSDTKFENCNHFSDVNKIREKMKLDRINWNLK